MNDNPLVSICIPTYNGELYIDKCITSAINQSYNNIEIIISDDQSIDDTINIAKELLEKNTDLFIEVENKFKVEKEILLALWGIETYFGKHVGKMDIISSLATLSYDKRRKDFFSSQLLTLLKLIDQQLIDPSKLYGSWAGAYGNFQFMRKISLMIMKLN